MPAVTPITIPLAESTVAIAGFADVHTPPPIALLSVVVLPWHTVDEPVIIPAVGIASTVIDFVVEAAPHEFVVV